LDITGSVKNCKRSGKVKKGDKGDYGGNIGYEKPLILPLHIWIETSMMPFETAIRSPCSKIQKFHHPIISLSPYPTSYTPDV